MAQARIAVVLLALACLLLTGCGQKGPLYLPDSGVEQPSQPQPKKPKQ